MAKYLISYDLTNAKTKDYDAMDKAIKLGMDENADRVLDSQWIVDTNIMQAEGICTRLKKVHDSQGQLLVICLDSITNIAVHNITSQKLL